MEPSTKRNLRRRGGARTMVAALALATVLGGMSTVIARAAGDDRRYEDRQDRDQRGHQQPQRRVVQHSERYHRGYAYEHPREYHHAPPPVEYYQPAPPPAIDFVFPFHLR